MIDTLGVPGIGDFFAPDGRAVDRDKELADATLAAKRQHSEKLAAMQSELDSVTMRLARARDALAASADHQRRAIDPSEKGAAVIAFTQATQQVTTLELRVEHIESTIKIHRKAKP